MEISVGYRFLSDGKTWTVTKVTPKMVLAGHGRKGSRTERWFWQSSLSHPAVRARLATPKPAEPADLEA